VFAKVVAGLIVAVGLVLGTQAYGLAIQTSDGYKDDATYMIGHKHWMSYNQSVCSGGPISGKTVNQIYNVQSRWRRQPYYQGWFASIKAYRNTGQMGTACNGGRYIEHRSSDQEVFYPSFSSTRSSDGWYYSSYYSHSLPSTWHYLYQVPADVVGSCLNSHILDHGGIDRSGTHPLYSSLRPSPSSGVATSCYW
jgi:hypothetical protein